MSKIILFAIFFQFSLLSMAQTTIKTSNSEDEKIYSKIDFSKLSEDVKQKLNSNKIAGQSLFNGIERNYVADVSCISSQNDVEQKLLFLKNSGYVISIEFVNSHRIIIHSNVNTDSEMIKSLFLNNQVTANFIEQKLAVKH